MTRHIPFELLMFSTDLALIGPLTRAGVDGFVVDWECIGKPQRQAQANTEINSDTVEDLRRVRANTSARVLCRINGFGPTTRAEVESVVGEGADELLLPMVRDPAEVEQVLDWTRGRCGVGILVETPDAVEAFDALTSLPLSRLYVGLNDLGLARGASNIFEPVVDGLVEGLRRRCGVPFGFGGLTLPDRGDPVPCRLLIGEMARLDCRFSFLRRSFRRDIRGRDPEVEVARLRQAIQAAWQRTEAESTFDHDELTRSVRSWEGNLLGTGSAV